MTESTNICQTIQVSISSGGGRRRTSAFERGQFPDKTRPTADFLSKIMPGKRLEHVGRPDSLAIGYYINPSSLFFQAVHCCFDKHLPLTLRPEVLMHLIVHEVAQTVKMSSTEYRHLFTMLADKDTIEVRHDGLRLGNPSSPWHEAIGLFEKPLSARVPSDIMSHLLPSFSTHTSESRTASLVAFMDAASPYYDYRVRTMCGIPEVRLAGEPEDYRRMREAAGKLAEIFGRQLGIYFRYLLPVLETLAKTAAGERQDEHFWRSVYKFESHSGGNVFNGWLSAFVNYIQIESGIVAKRTDLYDWENAGNGCDMRGLSLGSVPSQVSTVPFAWQYYSETKKMLFAGGPLAVEAQDGAVMPVLSYAVLHA